MKKHIPHEKPIEIVDEQGRKISNPNKLTINQHVISCRHLQEWSKNGKTIQVYDVDSNSDKEIPANNPYFGVSRLWDQETEAIIFKEIEDKFHAQIEFIKEHGVYDKDHGLNDLVEYYALLCVRCDALNQVRPHFLGMDDSPGESTKAQLEQNELDMANSDGEFKLVMVPESGASQHISRTAVSMMICRNHWVIKERLINEKWILFYWEDVRLIISDAFNKLFDNELHMLPITPSYCLVSESLYRKFNNRAPINGLNDLMRRLAKRFYAL